MCGIAGRISLNKKSITLNQLKQLHSHIVHRGPDDLGFFVSDNQKVGFAFSRLAIIDLSPKGHQPMHYKNYLTIIFNGEIYNFKQERKKLEKIGYKFRSQSDTEVIMALYDKYGEKCVDHLRGMFAFAIYDSRHNTVFLARDRMGVKPLKYFFNGSVFIFASELKALLSQPEIRPNMDWDAINHFLSFGYCPNPMTGFKNIHKLKPGHTLTIDLNTNKITVNQYWKLDYSQKLQLSESDWKELLLKELEESTKIRMEADVPVGAFLSGGVDSSAVVALMAQNSKTPIKTFTIGFEEKKYDERDFAQKIADLYHTDHHVLIAKPRAIESLPELVAHYEEPFADSSSVITTMVSELAREKVTVILNGDGSDESFGGYLRHNKLVRDLWLYQHPFVFDFINPAKKYVPKVNKFLQRRHEDVRQKFASYNQYFWPTQKMNLYKPDFYDPRWANASQNLWIDKCLESGCERLDDQLFYADLTNYFADDQLVKVDMGSMKHGLEARSPFTDHKFMELVAKIPLELKVKKGINKYILKKSLEPIVPYENLYRKKMGFSVPLSQWFEGELNDFARDRLFSKKSILREFIKASEVKSMLDQHTEKNDFGPRLWALLVLQLWWENYF